jgi:hypothetical protein
MKFMQDYNFKVSGNKTNTIQFSIDVLNVGNLNLIGSSSNSQVYSQLCFCRSQQRQPTYTFNGTNKTFTMLVYCQDGKRNLTIYILVYSIF